MSKTKFGKKIGKNEYCETSQEAFVLRLWSYNDSLSKAQNEQEEEIIDEERAKFLKTFSDQIEKDVCLNDFLTSSASFAREKAREDFKLAEAILSNGGNEVGLEFLNNAKNYCSVAKSIESLIDINQEISQDPCQE